VLVDVDDPLAFENVSNHAAGVTVHPLGAAAAAARDQLTVQERAPWWSHDMTHPPGSASWPA
jgi:hypothetical protein